MGAHAGTLQGPRRARLGRQALAAGWRGSAAGSAEGLQYRRWGRTWRACSAEDVQARTPDCLLCLSAWGGVGQGCPGWSLKLEGASAQELTL